MIKPETGKGELMPNLCVSQVSKECLWMSCRLMVKESLMIKPLTFGTSMWFLGHSCYSLVPSHSSSLILWPDVCFTIFQWIYGPQDYRFLSLGKCEHRGNGKKEASSNKFSFPRLIVVPLSIHLLVEYISRQQISSLFLFYSFIYGCKSWKCCTIIKPLSFWLLHKCHSRTDSSQSWVWWCTKGKGKVNRCIIK